MVKLPEPGNNPIYPAGAYVVRIKSFEFTEAKTGTKQIMWKAEIVEPEAHRGRNMVTYTALTETAVWKVANLIGAAGIKFDPNSIDTDTPDFADLCGMTVGRLSVWVNAEGTDLHGAPRNEIVKFDLAPEQEVEEFLAIDDSPFA